MPPNAQNTALTLHQAIWNKNDTNWPVCGIPEKFYTDHGSDFTSHHMEQVAIDLKINLMFSKVGVPRGRGKIERFFQTVNQTFLEQLPGYINNNDTPSNLINFHNFEEKLRYFLIEDYNQKEHSTIHTTPISHWNSNHFFPNMPSSLEQLDLLLLEIPKSRKVHSDGIHFQGFRYSNTNLEAYVGEYVLIRYKPNDMAEIRVFYRDEFLCTAICPEIADYSIDIKDIQHARSQRRKHLKQNIASPSTTELIKEEKNCGYSPQETTKNVKKLKRYRND